MLTADEARELLDSVAIARNSARDGSAETDEPALIGLRDRALIGVMVYTFARIQLAVHGEAAWARDVALWDGRLGELRQLRECRRTRLMQGGLEAHLHRFQV